jgi:hypothetical protein
MRTTVFSVLLPAAMLGCLAIVYFNDPAKSPDYPPCPFHAITGLYCPGCGSLRAMHQLLHGDLQAAWHLNPLMVAFIPVLGLLAAFPRWANRPWVAHSAFMILLTYGIVRNIPLWPFPCLAPH